MEFIKNIIIRDKGMILCLQSPRKISNIFTQSPSHILEVSQQSNGVSMFLSDK